MGEDLGPQDAAEQVAIGVGQGRRGHRVRGLLARRRAAHGGGRDARRPVARHGHIVAVAFQIEAVDPALQPAIAAQVPATARKQRDGLRVLDLALGAVEADAAAVSVIVGAAGLEGRAHGQVKGAEVTAADGGDLGADAVALQLVVGGDLGHHPPGQALRLGRLAGGDVVDHPAGGPDALDGVGAEDDLDPVDEEGIDGVAVAAVVAQRRRLRHAVDEIERRASAQGLAEARQLLPRRREGGHQGRHRIDGRGGQRRLLDDGLGVDELDRGGDRGARGLDPGGGDHHLVQKRRVRGGPLLGRRGKRGQQQRQEGDGGEETRGHGALQGNDREGV